jgi:hypothetical protein
LQIFWGRFSLFLSKQIKVWLIILVFMSLSPDVTMPVALLIVITVAMLLNKRVEGKLAATIEEREFKTRDVILLVIVMATVISVIAYTSIINPGAVFQNILLLIFLTSYTMLLFTFSYVFSNISKTRAQLISAGFGVAAIAAGVGSLLGPLQDSYTIFRVVAFFGLASFCFAAAIYAQTKTIAGKSRWYVAVQPPAIFVLLFVFFNFISNSATEQIWFPYLLDVFGLTFAVLIILYLSSMFSWKTVGLFAVLLTVMDIILVIGTGTMVQAATQFTGLGLPVLVYLPNVPIMFRDSHILLRGLGLGDFFFAGVLAVQTYNKFGKKIAFTAVGAMAIAFGIWEAFLGGIITWFASIGHPIGGFPGTLMIISGWAPVIVWAVLLHKAEKPTQPPVIQQSSSPTISLP